MKNTKNRDTLERRQRTSLITYNTIFFLLLLCRCVMPDVCLRRALALIHHELVKNAVMCLLLFIQSQFCTLNTRPSIRHLGGV